MSEVTVLTYDDLRDEIGNFVTVSAKNEIKIELNNGLSFLLRRWESGKVTIEVESNWEGLDIGRQGDRVVKFKGKYYMLTKNKVNWSAENNFGGAKCLVYYRYDYSAEGETRTELIVSADGKAIISPHKDPDHA